MSVSYSLWYNVFKKHCHTKAFEVQNDPTRSASLINLFELGRIVHFGAAGQIRTADLILTNHRRAFQPLLYKALRRFFCPKRMRSQPVCSIVSVRSFPRVGHGVGQTTFRTRTRGAPPTAANQAAAPCPAHR